MKTYVPKIKNIERKYYLVDVKDKILGRVATKIADVLRGKNKRIFTPHLDTGDFVIVINAAHVKVTGNKPLKKEYQKYSGYHGGQKTINFESLLKKSPTQVIRLAVNRMIPKGALGNKIKTKLKIYAGDKHPHQAQKPIVLEV